MAGSTTADRDAVLTAGAADGLRCDELVERLTDLLEGACAPAEVARLREHLAGCDGCSAYAAQIGTAQRLLAATPPERQLAALRAGDEQAFRDLVAEHGSALLRLALQHSPSRALAEEVVQETWLAVVAGIDGFAGRSSLRTWMGTIVLRTAARRAGSEGRSRPYAGLGAELDGDQPAVDPARFIAGGPYAGHWRSFPDDWSGLPESRLLGTELRTVLRAAVAGLPPAQRTTVVLRDIEGWTAAEVSELLGVSEGNQRVLLHRGRSVVRRHLEEHLAAD